MPAETARRLEDAARAGRLARAYQSHAGWTPEQLRRFQRLRLARLLRHAVRNSVFYRRLYAGLDLDGPQALSGLPVLERGTMMERFSDIVTDPRLDLRRLKAHVGGLCADELCLGRYRVLTSSGSGGVPGLFVFSRKEWSLVLASQLRAQAFGRSCAARRSARRKTAFIVSPRPHHISRRVGAFWQRREDLYLDATSPIERLSRALNAFQPEAVVGYSTLVAILAEEQLAGRLCISPREIGVGAELLTASMERRIRRAWGVAPSQSYGMTECSCWGANCRSQKGIHVFEDLGIMEVVDERHRAVPDGMPGTKVLLTNLYNFTQPLIRYEVSDLVTMAKGPCPCGSPFRLIRRLSGRDEDILSLPGVQGRAVAVAPAHFRLALEGFDRIVEYQVVEEALDRLRLRLVLRGAAPAGPMARRIAGRFKSLWDELGVRPPRLQVDIVERIARGPSGKLKTICRGAALPA